MLAGDKCSDLVWLAQQHPGFIKEGMICGSSCASTWAGTHAKCHCLPAQTTFNIHRIVYRGLDFFIYSREMMGASPGGPAKLCDKLLVRAEALCAYGEQQKMHQQYFLLGGSVKRHRVNRCLWLLQVFAEFLSHLGMDLLTDLGTKQPVLEQASAHSACASSLVRRGQILPDRRDQELQLLSFCCSNSFLSHWLCCCPHWWHRSCKAVIESWEVMPRNYFLCPEMERLEQGRLQGCFFIEASFGSHSKFWILLGDWTQSNLVLLLSWPCQTAS